MDMLTRQSRSLLPGADGKSLSIVHGDSSHISDSSLRFSIHLFAR